MQNSSKYSSRFAQVLGCKNSIGIAFRLLFPEFSSFWREKINPPSFYPRRRRRKRRERGQNAFQCVWDICGCVTRNMREMRVCKCLKSKKNIFLIFEFFWQIQILHFFWRDTDWFFCFAPILQKMNNWIWETGNEKTYFVSSRGKKFSPHTCSEYEGNDEKRYFVDLFRGHQEEKEAKMVFFAPFQLLFWIYVKNKWPLPFSAKKKPCKKKQIFFLSLLVVKFGWPEEESELNYLFI